MNVTIKDIAKQLGLSHSTVSRALNDSPHISKITREKVKKCAAQMGYVPNLSARSLVTQSPQNIGLFFSTLSHGTAVSFFYNIFQSVNNTINGSYNLTVKSLDKYDDFNSVKRSNFSGIILVSQSLLDIKFVEHLAKNKIPSVILNNDYSDMGFPCFVIDDEEGIRLAVDNLYKHGHRSVALIGGKEGFRSSNIRLEAFKKEVNKLSIMINKDDYYCGDYGIKSGYDGTIEILRSSNRPTAIFCMNDEMAMGAIQAANHLKISVPNELSIQGYDDDLFSAFVVPQLSTVHRPLDSMSCVGTEYLLKMIREKVQGAFVKKFEPTLIHRESVSAVE